MKLVSVHVDDLKPAPYNPRVDLQPGDPDFEKIRRSIQEFGYVDPIIYNDRTGHVIGGHQRLKVLMDEGFTEISAIEVDLDETKEKALNVALNKISGDWDMDLLGDLLAELDNEGFEVEVTGFESDELEELMSAVFREDDEDVYDDQYDPDEILEDEGPSTVQPGELWDLGGHRLLCGDSTNEDDILMLVGDETVDMIFTDPPYNVNYEGGTSRKLKIANDHMEGDEFLAFLVAAFDNMFKVTKEGGPIYVCHADSEGLRFRLAYEEAGFLLKQVLVWVKNRFVLGRQDYHWRHEPILYGWKPGAGHEWFGGRKQDTVLESSETVTIEPSGDKQRITIASDKGDLVLEVPSYEIVYEGTDRTQSIWRMERPSRNAEHPTMKPIELCARAIENSSARGEIVLDPFGGSGSTLIAAEQLGRRCFMMEFDGKYADVIIDRWQKLTGKKAIRLS